MDAAVEARQRGASRGEHLPLENIARGTPVNRFLPPHPEERPKGRVSKDGGKGKSGDGFPEVSKTIGSVLKTTDRTAEGAADLPASRAPLHRRAERTKVPPGANARASHPFFPENDFVRLYGRELPLFS